MNIKKEIIHICSDEKFLRGLIIRNESDTIHYHSYIVVLDSVQNRKYTKDLNEENIYYVTRKDIRKNINIRNSSNKKIVGILVHGLSPLKAKLCNSLSDIDNTPIGIIPHGADIYTEASAKGYISLYKIDSIRSRIHDAFSYIKGRLKSLINGEFSAEKKLLENTDLIMSSFKSDIELLSLCKSIELSKIERIDYQYRISDFDPQDITRSSENLRIMLNQSGSRSGNHVYTINKLSKSNIQLTYIIPLSYGNSKVIKTLKTYKNVNAEQTIEILEQFLPYKEYTKILYQTDIYCSGSKRQEGVGNVLLMMQLKKPILMDKESTLYKDLTGLGFIIGKIEDFINYPIQTYEYLIRVRNINYIKSKDLSSNETTWNAYKSLALKAR